MTVQLLFWVLMLLWVVLGGVEAWPKARSGGAKAASSFLLLFALFLMLGWQVFGAPIR